jgi:3-hydroxypropanoate dehydrogenase
VAEEGRARFAAARDRRPDENGPDERELLARADPVPQIGRRQEADWAAPACVIIGYDTQFYEHLPRLFPHNQTARTWFEGKPDVIQATVMRNGSLQGAYFMLAARALGLDCGPMSGFDNAGVDKEFFPEGRIKSNFVCNIGYGDPAGLFERSPRLAFDEIAKVL